jgi:uncharacterized membrane protein YdfJ with MMPL/SSD domain
MSGEVAELRLSRLNVLKAEMAAAAASSVHDSHVQVEGTTDLALQVQGLQQQILAMSQQMQQMQAAYTAAEHRAVHVERALRESEARSYDLRARFDAVCRLQHQVSAVMGVSPSAVQSSSVASSASSDTPMHMAQPFRNSE